MVALPAPAVPRWLRWSIPLCCAVLAGCAAPAADLGYYWQSARGHWAVLHAARPVADWLDDPSTPEALRQRLVLSQRLRDFAVSSLGLPDNAAYRRYADLGRSAVVWNVVAAPELSLSLKTWCFPLLGCVGYRGYFERDAADQQAGGLRSQGWETAVYGVPAYSTLGKLPGAYAADPLLNTFIGWPEMDLAQLIFHELAHQVAYASDDTVFNESFATAVEQLGARQWLASGQATPGAGEAAARDQARRRDFRTLVAEARAALLTVYASEADDDSKRQRKAAVLADLRTRHARIKTARWSDYTGYDDWFARANNASLAVQAAYHSRVAAFEVLFEQQGHDWPRFLAEAARLAGLPRAERNAALAALESKRRDGEAVAPLR